MEWPSPVQRDAQQPVQRDAQQNGSQKDNRWPEQARQWSSARLLLVLGLAQRIHNRLSLPTRSANRSMQVQVNLRSRGGKMDITEVARRSGIPASTLRIYEEKGLIASIGRRGLRRVFDPGVLERLALIAVGRAA
jgi:MerR family regulatory protein